MPGSVISSLRHRMCIHLLLLISRGGGDYYYPHLTDEETEGYWTCLRSQCYLRRHDFHPRLSGSCSEPYATSSPLRGRISNVLSSWASIQALKEKGYGTQSGVVFVVAGLWNVDTGDSWARI